jgi:uncharacterized protein YhaN
VRLERLTLAPYGRFADRGLSFRADAALHVVLGVNESGKTTTLSAIGDLLFGFPLETPYAFAHDMRLLRVGGAFRLADGSLLEVRRRKGAKNTLVDAADQPVPEDALRQALGAVDRKTFKTEFGLTALALREGGDTLVKAGGGLAESLAASSASLTALSRLGKKLGEEADALFTPRRSSSKAYYVALDRHEDAERRLRDAIVTADALKVAEDTVLSARAREIDLKAEHEETGRALARLQRAQRAGAKLARLAALALELEAFADLPAIPSQTLADWRAALAEDMALRAEWDRLAADEATDEAAIGALQVDAALLAEGEAVDALRERLGAVRKAAQDLPRRVEARSAAEASLDELARRLGLADHSALLAAPPTDPAIARARGLIEARRRADEKHREAVALRDRALAERDRLRGASGADAIDPEPLKRRLAALADVSADADQLRRERVARETEARALAEEAARLDPNGGEIDALARLALPDEASLAQHVRAEEEGADAGRAAEARLANARRAVETGEAALAKRAADAAGATRVDWIAARERRDLGFERLGAALEGEAAERRERFEGLRSLTLAADALADSVLADSERAARLQAAREELAARREELKRAEADLSTGDAIRASAQADWRALWSASGLEPRAPAAMARWRERVAGLLARRAELAKRRADVEALSQKVESARAALVSLLAEFGFGRAAELPFDSAYREARSHLEALQDAWMRSRDNKIATKRAERDEAEAETAVTRETGAQEKQAAAWPAAMIGIGLGGAATLEEAEAALDVWRSVALPRQAMAREARSVEGIEEDIASFEAGVAAVVAAAAPSLASDKAPETLTKLMAALGESRRAADARERLRQAIAARGVAQRGLDARRKALAKTLADATAKLRASDAEALATTLDRLEQRQALESERAGLRRDLGEIADGLDEAALRAEQADLDFAVLSGRIDLAKQRQGQLLHEIGEAAGALREARGRLDALSQGRDAAGAARDREEASAELLDIAERWIVRQAAARLAARAIERHRAAAQDPLVARAGELFRLATADAFAGLGADYDEEDRPVLVALRGGGERVRIEGLSEGPATNCFYRCASRCWSAARASHCRSSATTFSSVSTKSAPCARWRCSPSSASGDRSSSSRITRSSRNWRAASAIPRSRCWRCNTVSG